FLLATSCLFSQEVTSLYISERVIVSNDTISLTHKNLNPSFFEIKDTNGNIIDTENYDINFETGKLIFQNLSEVEVEISALKFPDFLTQNYSVYDPKRIVENEEGMLYTSEVAPIKKFIPFEGLNTSGSISRGITVGNNQNAVTNSSLDLQITGKLSDKVSIRASIQDSNIPVQEGGYSQKLDEFDQIFIELFSDKWSIRAGDLFLEN